MIKAKKIFNTAKKIAIVRTDKIGDMVLTLPMGLALKERFPDTEIIFIASKYTAPLLENNPAVDKALFVEDYAKGIRDIFKQEKPDIVFFPRPRYDEMKAAYVARVPHRIATAYRLYSFFANHKIHVHRKISDRHEAEYNVDMINRFFEENLPVRLSAPKLENSVYNSVREKLAGHLTKDKFIIVHPGSGGSAKDIPLPILGEAAKQISEQFDIDIILTGTKQEREPCSVINKICKKAVDLSGQLDLSEMIALTDLAHVLVANSTGVLHVAASFGTKVVGLYPNTPHISAKRWGPYTKAKRIVSPPNDAPETRDDMKLIKPEEISRAIAKFLENILRRA